VSRKTATLLPATDELLRQFGERLRLARLRRRLSAKQVAERAGMNPMTLRSLERGGSGVTIGAYLAVMQVLGIEKELELLAQADPVGHSLQDALLMKPALAGLSRAVIEARLRNEHQRQPASSSTEPPEPALPLTRPSTPLAPPLSLKKTKTTRKTDVVSNPRRRGAKSGFVSSRELAALLAPASKVRR
jgi:transcriptional regulator with XRE-family HTH domain